MNLSARQHVLIIEDDPDISALVRMQVRECGADVREEASGSRGFLAAQSRNWDLIVLDWILPGLDGISLCRRLRSQQFDYPILMLTARTAEMDRVQGLDAGADDYVAKPFSLRELQARLRAQLRRASVLRSGARLQTPLNPIHVGSLVVDPTARSATVNCRDVGLTNREFELLLHFVSHPARVFSRDQLLRAVWGAGFDGYEHTVNSHINRLRAKIEAEPASPRLIVTVWGAGYRFDASALS
jgi:DNA-binding response OmpR family regulator